MTQHCPEQILQLPHFGFPVKDVCGSPAEEGFRAMLMMPSMLFPLLLVLFAGLCLLNQYRRSRSCMTDNF